MDTNVGGLLSISLFHHYTSTVPNADSKLNFLGPYIFPIQVEVDAVA